MIIVYLKNLMLMRKFKLSKKKGDDKLVISLVLIAVGVALCFIYRNQINTIIASAADGLTKKIEELFNDATIS